MLRRSAAVALLLGLAAARSSSAQLPGESIFANKGNLRDEFLAKAAEEVQRSLRNWSSAINEGDKKGATSRLMPDLLFGPIEGWLARGPEALDSLRSYLPRMKGYSITVLDFDASGAMGYVYAAVRYQFESPKGREYRDVEATLVLLQRRDDWKIRSYVERVRSDPAAR